MMFYIILALAAGANIVISNSINAALGKRIGLLNNALVFYTIALFVSAVIFIIFSAGEPFREGKSAQMPYYAYIGLMIPIATLFLNTFCMQKFSVVNYVMLTYISEIITAIIVDYFISGEIVVSRLIGGAFMIAGVYADNKILDANHRKSLTRR